MTAVMRRVYRTLSGLCVLPKIQGNRAVLFRTRFTIWRSEIHISLKLDALNRRRRRFPLRCTIHHI